MIEKNSFENFVTAKKIIVSLMERKRKNNTNKDKYIKYYI